jgi:hypothetical protein
MAKFLHQVNGSYSRTKREALGMFWIKMKTDLSFSQIASLFDIPDPMEDGRKKVSDAFHSVSKSLNVHFVPNHLGLHLISPQKAISHNTPYSSTFFGPNPTTIWDGTYLYMQKSSNYARARQTYSGHKKRPLVKFMSIVLPDGHVLETIGPFYSDGKNNDAGMTSKILKEKGFKVLEWLKSAPNQVVVVDRGFRNVLEELEQLNVTTKMPSLDPKGKKNQQSSTEAANNSRLVTKVRWVVEAYHGRFKKFKFFDTRMHTAHLDVINECLRITTAALNAFRPPIYAVSVDEEERHYDIANKMFDLC